MLNSSTLRIGSLAVTATYTYLQIPRSTKDLESVYHGTSTDRMPNVEEGQIVQVKNHFFFTEDPSSAKNYARGVGFSAFRPASSNEGSPLVLRVSPLPSSNSCWKRGVFGFNKYFPDGTLVKVIEIEYPQELSPTEKEQIYQSRHC